ncbi:hypothetical protein CRYUN_Cryun37aG0105500 [Craigia yunnanensis]
MHETTNLSSVAGQQVAINEIISIPVRYHSGEGINSGIGFEEKSKQMDAQTEDDKRKIKSRSAVPQTSTGSLSLDVEFNSGNKRPVLACDFFARGWCIKGSSCRFLHIKDSGNNPRQQPEEDVAAADGELFSLMKSKDKSMGTSPTSQRFSASTDDLGPSTDVRRNSIGQNLPTDNYAKPASLSNRVRSTFRNSFLPGYISSLSGSVTSLGNIYSENQSYHVSTWLASLPYSSSPSACSLGAQKVSDYDRECHSSRLSSLLQGTSPFCSSEPENFPVNDIARDPLHIVEYRIKISSDDWEPSERGLLNFLSSQGPSLLDVAYPPTYGDSTSMGLLDPEYLLTTDANDGTSAADMQIGTLVKDEISSVASHVKDISKTNKIDTDHDGRHRRDGTRKDLKVDRLSEKNEIDVELEHKADGDVLKESKARRHFHAALVDLIKELLKPTWREGHLSKDAHNIIVKNAVDKVLGTIQPHQIPITFESVKQYLSSSQPKIARLVEGYIEKYRKSWDARQSAYVFVQFCVHFTNGNPKQFV